MLLQQIIQTQAEYMTTKGNSAWDKLCALVAKQRDTAKCNTEHGLTQLSTGLAVMSLSAVPKILLKTPNNFPNDSAEQLKLVSASASALRGTETQVANCNLKPPGGGGGGGGTCDVTPLFESSLPLLWFLGPVLSFVLLYGVNVLTKVNN